MSCGCLEDIRVKLAPDAELEVSIFINGSNLVARPFSRILRKDNGRPENRRGKPSLFAFAFCPFCGSRYNPKPTLPAEGPST